MRTFTLIAILTCALLVIYHAAEAEELEAKDVIESKALATLDEERFECRVASALDSNLSSSRVASALDEERFECSLSCDIKKNGKPCKGSGEKKCSGGWRCKMNFCLKF
uniref:Omega-Theraphotoxin-Ct1a_4 n=1 Tax=Coremiocnemis tropix TaxID=1904443 RepID=A0A482ZHX9_CORTR